MNFHIGSSSSFPSPTLVSLCVSLPGFEKAGALPWPPPPLLSGTGVGVGRAACGVCACTHVRGRDGQAGGILGPQATWEEPDLDLGRSMLASDGPWANAMGGICVSEFFLALFQKGWATVTGINE